MLNRAKLLTLIENCKVKEIDGEVDRYSSRCMHDPNFMALTLVIYEILS